MNWKHGIAALILLGSTFMPLAAEGDYTGLTAAQIEAFSKPTLTPLIPNEDLMYDRRYMKLAGEPMSTMAPMAILSACSILASSM